MQLYCLCLFFAYALMICEATGSIKSKNPLPYFRRRVEELTEDTTVNSTLADDLQNSLVSFLIKNVREIYNELDEASQDGQSTSVCTSTKERVLVGTTSNVSSDLYPENSTDSNLTSLNTIPKITNDITTLPAISSTYSNEVAVLKNVTHTLVHFSDKEISNVKLTTTGYELTEKEELMHLSKNLDAYETDRRQRDNDVQPLLTYGNGSNDNNIMIPDHLRSCIVCNNVAMQECSDPKNRLIPAMVCEREDDMCYSLHTPFGIIDRGCFNVNHNLTTYVCSCNLCNYISISEMPYIFSNKRDWVDNVVELSRTRHLRQSVFKDMACLKCETNATAKKGDMLDNANCLEGNIGSLPTEECKENEICGIKAIRKDGYLWRGCVKTPLFNYWWALCDSDLCNYDSAMSIYELN